MSMIVLVEDGSYKFSGSIIPAEYRNNGGSRMAGTHVDLGTRIQIYIK